MSKSGDLWLATDPSLGIVIWVLGNNGVGGAVSRLLLLFLDLSLSSPHPRKAGEEHTGSASVR